MPNAPLCLSRLLSGTCLVTRWHGQCCFGVWCPREMSTNLCWHPIYHELFAKLSQIMQSEATVVNAKLQWKHNAYQICKNLNFHLRNQKCIFNICTTLLSDSLPTWFTIWEKIVTVGIVLLTLLLILTVEDSNSSLLCIKTF